MLYPKVIHFFKYKKNCYLTLSLRADQNQAFLEQVHRQQAQKLAYEVQDLDKATGGEGGDNKKKDKKGGAVKHEKIDSYITKQPLKPITKKFTIDR